MKVLLTQSPSLENRTIGPPNGLCYMASILEKKGHQVRIIDSILKKYHIENILNEIELFKPEVVGISTVTQFLDGAIKICDLIKYKYPKILTILGGCHPSFLYNEILLNNINVDIIVRGEGEITLEKILHNYSTSNLFNIKGISFRYNGRIINNEQRELINDLDEIPLPAYHLLDMNNYKISDRFFDIGLIGNQGDNYCTIITARGCPYNCIFCMDRIINNGIRRERSPENIIREIKLLVNNYNIKIIDFIDPVFTINKNWTKEICNLILKENINFSWICTTRVDLIDEEIIKLMKEAGCKIIFFGMESGIQMNLDFLNKNFKTHDIIDAVNIVKKFGVKVAGSFIIGIPGETKKMIFKTILFAKRLNLDNARFPILIPFPGTDLYKFLDKNNLMNSNDIKKMNYSNSIIKLSNISSIELKILQFFAGIITDFKLKSLFNILKSPYKK